VHGKKIEKKIVKRVERKVEDLQRSYIY